MKTVIILIAIALGLSFPMLSAISWLIRPLVMLLLFFGFLGLSFERKLVTKELFYVVAANLLIPIPVYLLTRLLGDDISLAAFLVAATPTGVAVPVVIEFLHKRVGFAAMGVLFTNVVMAVALPLGLPLIAEYDGDIGVYHTVSSIAITVFIPLLLALGARRSGGRILASALRLKFLSLYTWALAIALACAEARQFVIEYEIPFSTVVNIGWVVLIVCALNFVIGYLLGGKEYIRECGQVLGQKNTIFSVWIGITFLSPVAAIGPVCYIIFQNIFNCVQIALHDWKRRRE